MDHNQNTLPPLPTKSHAAYPPHPPLPPPRPQPAPIVTNFTDVNACIDYIVPLIIYKRVIITHLNRLVTDKGIVITDMPIFRYCLEFGVDEPDKTTLNRLEFRDGAVYDILCVDKLFGWVTSRNNGLGTIVSIDLTTTLIVKEDRYGDENAGEYALNSGWL